jgi:hypothetical protein
MAGDVGERPVGDQVVPGGGAIGYWRRLSWAVDRESGGFGGPNRYPNAKRVVR